MDKITKSALKNALNIKIGAIIKLEREKSCFTQTELANASGLKRSSIAKIESGNQGLSLELIYLIAIKLDVKLSTLLPKIENIKKDLTAQTLDSNKKMHLTEEITPDELESILNAIG